MAEEFQSFPQVSIVIPTLNNKNVLRKVLQEMLKLDYPADYEVIVVNDGSSDGTKEMLESEFSAVGKIKIINLPRSGVCKARNTGIRNSRKDFDFVVNMDHDCIPSKSWLRKMMQGFVSEKVGVVTAFGDYGGTSTAFRREVLEKTGGYDEDYFYFREDTDLTFKIMEQGYEFRTVKAPYVHDHKEIKPEGIVETAKHVWKRLLYHQNDVLLYKKHPNELTRKFLEIKYGHFISPVVDFKKVTGLWNEEDKIFSISSPRGIHFLENETPLHSIAIIFAGIGYVIVIRLVRIYASLKYGKVLI